MPAVSSPATGNRPSPLACEACRLRHLKCDGVSPICGRCAAQSVTCNYTPSRRGRGRRAHRRATSPPPQPPLPPLATPATPVSLSNGPIHPQSGSIPASSSLNTSTPWSLRAADRDRLVGLFYSHFFRAHPFLVPKTSYVAQQYPRYLDLAVCFVGLHYAKPALADAASLREAVSVAMSEIDEHTVHRVQALILYAIVLHSSQRAEEAASCIARASTIATGLGMNTPEFALANANANVNGSPVIAESLRRTWWELHTVDVYTAAINRRPVYETLSVVSYPLLPCNQKLYEAGQCYDHDPPTLRVFEDRVFSRNPYQNFSSMCYRIEAIRVVGRVLAVAADDDADPDNVQALDNALASWEHHLPPVYADVVGLSGEVDLMLFEARCFISCASIFLHFPRSDLPATVPSTSHIACAKGYTPLTPTSRHHTIKAIAASKDLSNLATIPWPLERHSPFFICCLVLGCVVQLAACSTHVHQCGLDCLQQHRDRVVLMLGALQRLGEIWPLAHNAVQCLKSAAETIFASCSGQDDAALEAFSFQYPTTGDGIGLANSQWFDLLFAAPVQDNLADM
ncbi:unnamed protein product [Periconia digitata]|uniref:Zn(2)-C6 fungal-type domain-containing protein n=1 Tax=Periconia digitata TaxID=1303443 RepID=A0A9W4XVB6_9PLEO|nr:unnamed protein product [Periconia digitata]